MSDRIPLLVLNPMTPAHEAQIAEHFELLYAPKPAQREAALAQHGARIRAVLTIGAIGLSAAEIDRMPALELICCLGAGYEQLDLPDLHRRGVVVANGAGTNAACVADHAFALVLAVLRQVRTMDRACRAGHWRTGMTAPAQASGKRLGIFGLGAIGLEIAKRAKGFDMPVAYCNRKPRDGVDLDYIASLTELAAWSDVLVCAAPGGAATHHAVNAEVLQALGPRGVLVNIGRGSVVDTAALAQALQDKAIAGAGLDVYDSEPEPPQALIGFDNLTITPHIGGWSPEAGQAMVDRFLDNALGHFSGRGVVSPVR
ncbi:hydroxyacid dehydrogenase [Comamonas serinivorans]|uniref:Hydroxyacid dehydrogenase n=1 Tax=Comamonas serinivorans TaxID=1082851 RepID=A0A1Y0ETD0_9BURK|nr:2-hydroxyacid dehydrogenase [Comamonas serinivorans]ARU06836.1 hydroxyacid dehydrogenase [Comamonas serinivorans]